MSEPSLFETVVEFPLSELEGLEPYDWPLDAIQALVYEKLPEYTPTTILSTKAFLLKGEQETMFEFDTITEFSVVSGYFRGLATMTLTEQVSEFERVRECIPSLWLEDKAQKMWLVPLIEVTEIVDERDDTIKVLDEDDPLLQQIDESCLNDAINLDFLASIFEELDPNDPKTTLYVRYLNTILNPKELWTSAVYDRLLIITDEAYRIEDFSQNQVASVYAGVPFQLITTWDDEANSYKNILTLSVDTGSEENTHIIVKDIRALY